MHQPKDTVYKTPDLPNYKVGILPQNAPLAVPFVPFQSDNPPQYGPEVALTRGTLFPGLDLPFKNMPNQTNPEADTLLGEIMGLSLALTDLHLYLDTHPQNQPAIHMFEHYTKLLNEKKGAYEEKHGPLTLASALQNGKYAWIDDPWPWEYREEHV